MSKTLEQPRTTRVPVRRHRLIGWVALTLAAWTGLVALNLWWLWEGRPSPSIQVIRTLIDQDRLDEAENLLRARLKRSYHDGASRMELARLLAGRADYAACATELGKVPAWWPDKPNALWREGQAWMSIDRARAAESAFLAYFTKDPGHPDSRPLRNNAFVHLVNLYSLEDRWDEVRELIWDLYPDSTPPGRHELRVMSLRTILERPEPTLALETLRAYVTADPEDADALRGVARQAFAARRMDLVDESMTSLLARRPADPRIWADRMEVLNARGETDQLAKTVEAVPEAARVGAGYWLYRGVVHQRRQAWDEASEALAKAWEADPGRAETAYRLALVERALGRLDQARTWRDRSEQLASARSELPDTLTAYLDANPDGLTIRPELIPIVERLERICRVLSLDRDARAWSEYLDQLKDAAG